MCSDLKKNWMACSSNDPHCGKWLYYEKNFFPKIRVERLSRFFVGCGSVPPVSKWVNVFRLKKNWMVCSSNGLLCWSRSIFKGLVFLRRRPLFIHIIKNQRKRDWIPYKKPSAKKVTPLKHINIKSSQITKEAPLNFINIKRSQIMWLAPLLTLQALTR